MSSPFRRLAGLRILVAEDEFLIALELEAMLAELGCETVGPVATLDAALELARSERLDGALLDMNLQDRSVYPAAEALHDRAVPFVLVTGYPRRNADPDVLRDAPRLRKPFHIDDLTARMTDAFSRL